MRGWDVQKMFEFWFVARSNDEEWKESVQDGVRQPCEKTMTKATFVRCPLVARHCKPRREVARDDLHVEVTVRGREKSALERPMRRRRTGPHVGIDSLSLSSKYDSLRRWPRGTRNAAPERDDNCAQKPAPDKVQARICSHSATHVRAAMRGDDFPFARPDVKLKKIQQKIREWNGVKVRGILERAR